MKQLVKILLFGDQADHTLADALYHYNTSRGQKVCALSMACLLYTSLGGHTCRDQRLVCVSENRLCNFYFSQLPFLLYNCFLKTDWMTGPIILSRTDRRRWKPPGRHWPEWRRSCRLWGRQYHFPFSSLLIPVPVRQILPAGQPKR